VVPTTPRETNFAMFLTLPEEMSEGQGAGQPSPLPQLALRRLRQHEQPAAVLRDELQEREDLLHVRLRVRDLDRVALAAEHLLRDAQRDRLRREPVDPGAAVLREDPRRVLERQRLEARVAF